MGVQVIPIPIEVVSHFLSFPFPIPCFTHIPMGFPFPLGIQFPRTSLLHSRYALETTDGTYTHPGTRWLMVSTTKQTPSLRQLTSANSSSLQLSLSDACVLTSGDWTVAATACDDRRLQHASTTKRHHQALLKAKYCPRVAKTSRTPIITPKPMSP